MDTSIATSTILVLVSALALALTTFPYLCASRRSRVLFLLTVFLSAFPSGASYRRWRVAFFNVPVFVGEVSL
jgi:hypothetical protein